MPKINRIRIINFSYNNDKRQILDERFNFYQGENALLSLKNGGGKSVLVQLMMQPVFPLAKIQNRSMKDFFRKKKTPAFVLIEWKLDDSGGYLLTGICMANKDAQGREVQDAESSLKYFTFTNQYSQSDAFDLVNIPLCRKEQGGTYILSYKEAMELLQDRMRDRKSDVVYYNSEENLKYAKDLLSFNISQDEWRNIIKQINSDEGGVINIFEKCKTSHQLMKDWLLKTVEKVVYRDREEQQYLEEMLQGLVNDMVENEQYIFEKALLLDFLEKMEGLGGELEKLSSIHEEKKGLEMDLARLHRHIEGQCRIMEEKIAENEAGIEQNRSNLGMIDLEERSHTYYKDSDRFEMLRLDHERSEGELDRTLAEIEEKITKEKVQKASGLLIGLREWSREKAALEEEIRRAEGQTEGKVHIERLKYSLKLQYTRRMEAYDRERNALQEGIEGSDAKLLEFEPAIGSLEETARNLERSKQVLEIGMKAFLKAEERMKKDLKVSIDRNLFCEADEKDLLREEKRLKDRRETLVKEKSGLENQQEEMKKRKGQVRVQQNEIAQAGLEVGIAISRATSEREGYLNQEGEIRPILSRYDIDFGRRFDGEELKRIFKGLISEYENSRFHFRSVLNGVEERLGSLKKGTLHISKAYAEFLELKDIRYDTGESYLRKLAEDQRESLLRNIPLLPYSFILSDADMEKVRYSYPEKPILQLVPLLTYGSLKEDLDSNGNLIELRSGAAVLCLFDEKMLSSSDLAAYMEEMEKEKVEARESLEHFNLLLRSIQDAAARVFAFRFEKGYLHELDRDLDTLEGRKREADEEKLKLDKELDALQDRLESLQSEISNHENLIMAAGKEIGRFTEYLDENREYERSVKKMPGLEMEIGEVRVRLKETRRGLEREKEANRLLRSQKDGLGREISEADMKAMKYREAAEADIIDEKLEVLEGRLEALIKESSSSLERLHQRRDEVNRSCRDKEKEIEALNLAEAEYIEVRFDGSLLSLLRREIGTLETVRKEQEKEERKTDREVGIAKAAMDNALNEVHRLSDKVIPREGIRLNFEERRKVVLGLNRRLIEENRLLDTKHKEMGRTMTDIEKVIEIGVLEVMGGYEVRKNVKEDFAGIKESLTLLRKEYDQIERSSDRRYDSLEREYSEKNPNISNIFKGLTPVRNQAKENPDNYYYFYERATSQRGKLNDLIRLYESKLENLEQNKKNMVMQSYHQALTLFKEIGKVTEDSSIHLAGKSRAIPMLLVEMVPLEEGEKDMEKMKNYIDRCAESIRLEMKGEKKPEEIRKNINKYMSNWELLNVISDLGALKIKAYKIDINTANSGYKTWEQVMKENSGGEKFVSFFSVLVALMSYTRTRSRVGDDYTRNKDTKVLLMDNPFGPISSEHLLIPLFEIAKKYNTQMICLTDLKQNSILNCFNVIYMLKIRSNTFNTMEYLKVEEQLREGEDLKHDENLEKAVFRAGDYEQISMI